MTDIPEDIMREARAVALEVLSHADGPILRAFNTIARALLAAEKRGAERERERCLNATALVIADIVSSPHDFGPTDQGGIRAAENIAAAIRKEG